MLVELAETNRAKHFIVLEIKHEIFSKLEFLALR